MPESWVTNSFSPTIRSRPHPPIGVRTLVTGAAGFVGWVLVCELAYYGTTVSHIGRDPIDTVPLFQMVLGKQVARGDSGCLFRLSYRSGSGRLWHFRSPVPA